MNLRVLGVMLRLGACAIAATKLPEVAPTPRRQSPASRAARPPSDLPMLIDVARQLMTEPLSTAA